MPMNVPPAKPVGKFRIENFLGNDSSNAPANVSTNRSPSAPNMIRETPGKLRKWIGYHAVETYAGRINGVHFLYGAESKRIVHAGGKLYSENTELYTGIKDGRSVAQQIAGKLYLSDGQKLLVYGKFANPAYNSTDPQSPKETYQVKTVESIAFVPVILIAKKPGGGGTLLNPVNLLQPKRTEKFAGDGATKIYQLSANTLDAEAVTVTQVTASGQTVLTENTEFTVNRETGKLTFTTAPPVPPVTGEDNIYITYAKTVAGYADKINHCDISTLYGVNGARDRIFVSGNPSFPNYDYYCQINDPTYWGDLWYSVLGQDNSKIMGYSIVNDQLAAHKNRSDDDTNIILRRGTMVNGSAAFPLSGSYQGTGAGSKYAFSVLETEPMFVTSDKQIFAVTPSDVLGERYAQSRSYYLNGLLAKVGDIGEAVSVVHNQFYFLAVGGVLYALDGTQSSREKNDPYSSRQYAGFYRTNVNARCLWVENETLYFGTENGAINAFYTDYENISNFNDNGAAIAAHWDTPEFSGNDFYNRKDFRRIAILLGAAVATGCRVWAYYDGTSELLIDYSAEARYFSYQQLRYSKFCYKTDRTPQEIIEKIKVKKAKKVRFRLENDVLNEPFALYAATAEFTESR